MVRTTIALFLAVLIGACSGSKDEVTIPPELGTINPNEIRLLATVVVVDTTRASRPTDPCFDVPCHATIRVDSVFGYGSGFPRPVTAGDELDVRFAFTLAPTDEVMPDLVESFPGLETGDAFWADVRAHPSPGPGNGATRFVIYNYYLKGDG